MKTEKETRTDSAPYNAHTRANQQIHEEYNSGRNVHNIVAAIDAGRARDISQETKKPGTPAFVIGSGPSLDEVVPLLKDWEGGIVCSSSHARTLVYHGAAPTHIIALDPFTCWDEFSGVDWSEYPDIKLVTHPGVWPDLIENWPNEMLLYREWLGSDQSYYAQGQKRMYTSRECFGKGTMTAIKRDAKFTFLIPTHVTMFACSPPTQLFIAGAVGYGNIFLAGCDFGYTYGKARFTEWKKDEAGEWHDDPRPWTKPEEIEQYNIKSGERDEPIVSDNSIQTERTMVYYKKNLVTAIRLSNQSVWACGETILTDEVLHANGAEVIATQGAGYKHQRKREIAKRTEPYLAGIGCFVLNGPKGHTFIETEVPLNDIPAFMKQMRRTYVCEKCGAQGISNDDAGHDAENCKACPNGRLFRINDIDEAKNLKRIERLIKDRPITLLTPSGSSHPMMSITRGAVMNGSEK